VTSVWLLIVGVERYCCDLCLATDCRYRVLLLRLVKFSATNTHTNGRAPLDEGSARGRQRTTFNTERHPWPRRVWAHDPRKRAAAGLHLRPGGRRVRPGNNILVKISIAVFFCKVREESLTCRLHASVSTSVCELASTPQHLKIDLPSTSHLEPHRPTLSPAQLHCSL